MFAALRRRLHVVELGWPAAPGIWERIRHQFGIGPALDPTKASFAKIAEVFHDLVQRQLRQQPCDVLFAPVASYELFGLVGKTPVVYASDATFRLYRLHYRLSIGPESEALLETMERRAIKMARRLLYPSRWAADSARSKYGARSDNIDVVPYGANLDNVPRRSQILERIPAYQSKKEVCRLLFVGRDFARKGGQCALDTLDRLNTRGVHASLTVVGTQPIGPSRSDVHVFPFLDKNNVEDAKVLRRLYLQSHFLLFPTRADCSPIALCEAAAFGLPVVSSDVGGIPDIVVPNCTGVLLPMSAGGQAYAEHIEQLWRDPVHYRSIVENARRRYDERLNWRVWAVDVADALRRAIGAH